MNNYWIEYGHRNLEDGYTTPIGVWTVSAYNIDDAIDRFLEGNDDDGFIMIRIARVHEDGLKADALENIHRQLLSPQKSPAPAATDAGLADQPQALPGAHEDGQSQQYHRPHAV